MVTIRVSAPNRDYLRKVYGDEQSRKLLALDTKTKANVIEDLIRYETNLDIKATAMNHPNAPLIPPFDLFLS
ncbi:MAG: hypothetical protein KGH98_04305 [Candidatus Micrarchaeota archaeon]|nr:hypothetical protein [Candidatus Micrarchaeota archaeon]